MSPGLLEQSDDDMAHLAQLPPPEDNKNAVEQKMQGVHLVENGENEKGWELFANEAVGTADSQWVLKNVKVQFFHENKSSFTVTGDVGEIDGTSKDMVIRGNVTTVSTNGYSFKTDTLRYLAHKKIMTSVDRVFMQGPPDNSGDGFNLTGEKLLVDIAKNKMSILDKVVTTKKIDGQNFRLTSVRADFFNTSQEAVFSGDVRMSLDTFKVRAPIAYFNYSNVSRALVRIVLKQGVQFEEMDRRGTSDELEMNLPEKMMTLRGRPKVQQGEDEISGHEIVFIDGGKKVKINNKPR